MGILRGPLVKGPLMINKLPCPYLAYATAARAFCAPCYYYYYYYYNYYYYYCPYLALAI